MTLDLNNVIVPYEGNKYYGRNIDKMPELIADGRVPISIAGVMEQRLYSGKQDWKDNYFNTGDAFIYHPDGRFKVVLDAQPLREITSESKLCNGALVLEDGVYDILKGQEFTIEEVKKLVGMNLTADKIKSNPLWKAFSRNEALLVEYVDKMFPEMNRRFGYNESMGVYLTSAEKVPTLRAVFVGRLGGRSMLDCGIDLGCGGGRLVGVAPEALNAPGKVVCKESE